MSLRRRERIRMTLNNFGRTFSLMSYRISVCRAIFYMGPKLNAQSLVRSFVCVQHYISFCTLHHILVIRVISCDNKCRGTPSVQTKYIIFNLLIACNWKMPGKITKSINEGVTLSNYMLSRKHSTILHTCECRHKQSTAVAGRVGAPACPMCN